jgi:hypothetical protein
METSYSQTASFSEPRRSVWHWRGSFGGEWPACDIFDEQE